jgi:hypothetical protein
MTEEVDLINDKYYLSPNFWATARWKNVYYLTQQQANLFQMVFDRMPQSQEPQEPLERLIMYKDGCPEVLPPPPQDHDDAKLAKILMSRFVTPAL